MRIVLVNHGTASDWGGGDSVQIQETGKILRERGHEVSIINSDRPEVRNADIVHIFNCRVSESFFKQIGTCQTQGVPIVVSPIWISIGEALWGSRGTFSILQNALQNGYEGINYQLEALQSRTLITDLGSGSIDAKGTGTFDLGWQNKVGNLLKTVDGVLTNSWLELKAVQKDLLWDGDTYEVANYGVNPDKFLDADPEIFREQSGIKEPFIMQAGRIEAGKNQAMLCWALKETKIPIVLIGGTKHWPSYAKLCKEIGGDRVTIINHLPQELLASAYAAAKVHCLVSWMDTCGLVSLEAALSGTPIVGSTFGHELEYLRNDAWLADPANPKSIKKAVISAWESGSKNKKTMKLKKRILEEYNWERTTLKTELFYKQVIENASIHQVDG